MKIKHLFAAQIVTSVNNRGQLREQPRCYCSLVTKMVRV